MLLFVDSSFDPIDPENKPTPRKYRRLVDWAILIVILAAIWLLLSQKEAQRLQELVQAKSNRELNLVEQIEWCTLLAKRDSMITEDCIETLRKYRNFLYKKTVANGLNLTVYCPAIDDSVVIRKKPYKHLTYGKKLSNEKEFLKNLKLLEISANIALIHQMLEEGTLIVSEPDSKNQTTYIHYHKIRFPLADGSSIKLTIKESPLGKLLYDIMILEE